MSSNDSGKDSSPRKQAAFWKAALSGAPALSAIKTDYQRPAVLSRDKGVVALSFDGDFSKGIEETGRRLGITSYIILLAGWAALLARLSRQDDVVVGASMPRLRQSGRGGTEGAPAGEFAVRLDLSDQPTVAQLLDRTKRQAREALENSDIALGQVVEQAGLVRDPSYHSLFQTLFVFDQGGSASPASLHPTDAGGSAGKEAGCDLVLSIRGVDGEITGSLSYATALFKPETAQRIAENYRLLLEGMLADETRCVMRLPIVSDAERRLVVETWNATNAPFRSDRCIHELFEERAAAHPDEKAVVVGDRQLTYGELNARANCLAHRLRSLGVEPDSRVAICVDRSLEMIVGILGVLKAGGCYVPLDPDYPEDRLQFMVSDSSSKVLLKKARHACAWAGGMPELDLDMDSHEQPNTNPDPVDGDTKSCKLAYVIYTSGSTGTPKAVMVEHRSVTNLLFDWSARFDDFGKDLPFQASMWTSFCFDVSVFEIFAALSNGGTLNIVPDSIRADPVALLHWLVQKRIGFGYLPPFFVRQLRALLDSSSVPLPFKHLLVGVEPLSEADLHWLRSATPGLAIVNGYGPTEATVFCTAHQEIAARQRNAPIGRPIANMRIYVLDEHRQPVPVGVPGELHIAGIGVARGYLNRPDLTTERFVADPFSAVPGARMYRTGDLGRWHSNGTIEFLGRNDSQVKLRGFRVELGEIEARLAQHAKVTEAAVLARDDSTGDKRLVAYFAGAEPLEIEALRKHLSEYMPEYMIPAAFVQLERLPLTPSGKLDGKRLPAPGHEAFVRRRFEPPRNAIEETIAAIWAELLKVNRIGRDDNFLELGGHSLLMIQVLSRLRNALNVDVPVHALFASPTLSEFADVVAAAMPTQLPAVTGEQRKACEPLSFAQQRLWFLAQIKGASEAYHIACGWRMRGPLDRVALRRALDRIVERHESLRTTFVVVDGKPMQRVAPAANGMRLVEQEAASPEEAARLANEESALPFDLERGPLIRGRLIRENADLCTLLVTMHHIVSDGWSMRVFMRELNALYAAFLEDRCDPLPPLNIQYADYAAWQRKWISADLLRANEEHWKSVLSGAPELLTLPLDYPRPADQSFAGGRVDFLLGKSQTQALDALGLQRGTTKFVTLLAGWAALLSRLSGLEDVVIGTPAANRGRAEIEGLIGFFVNTLALRVDASNAPTVAELLRRVSDRAWEAQENQDISFERVVELVNPARSPAYSPLFQVMFAWENDEGLRLEFPGLSEEPAREAAHRTTQFDLILTMRETRAGIEGELEYATALFKRETVERMAGYYQALLAGMASDHTRRIADIPLLSEAENQLLTRTWNAADLPAVDGRCIHELFEAQVSRTPDAIAVVYKDRALTYAALNAWANRLAHRLRAIGVMPESLVAICVERSVEMVVGLLAVLKAGGAYVPLDPAQPTERLRRMLADSAPVALLTLGDVPEDLAADGATGLQAVDLSQRFDAHPETNLDSAETGLKSHHLAYVIYTSGSTGKPKGVMVEHRNLVGSTLARHAAYGETGRFLLLSPVYFDSSVAGIFGTLTQAGTLVVAEESAIRDPSRLGEVLHRQRIDTLLCVPSLYRNYLECPDSGDRNKRLTKVIVAGETCPATLVRQSAAQEPQIALFNEYGPTEGTVWATMHPCVADVAGSVPIGRPVASARIYILDAQEKPVPIGVTGHIHIGGSGVARGYLNRPELTAERFVADPFGEGPGARMYKTGDVGRWLPDGTIEFQGRNDFQVKMRGFRVELGEIEAELLQHPAIRQAAVIAREDAAGEQRLVAYVVGNKESGAEEFRSHLTRRLPEYMVPAAYVRMQALPLTPNGKLDARALPAPAVDAYATSAYEAPAGEIETIIASIWSSLLKVERIGRRDSFFMLGGHSLLIVQVVSRLRKTLGVDVPLNALFAAPVLADFACYVASAAPARLPPVTTAGRQEHLPLSFAQRRLWFLAQMEGGSAAYHIPYELRLKGRLDKRALRRALDRIVLRHEALRTTFTTRDGEPIQRIESAEACCFPLVEGEATDPEEIARLIEEEAAAPFDLERGLPVRGRLLREADDLHALLVTTHHIVSDGWSMGVFAAELSALYNAYVEGDGDPLPALTVQYADYAVWQQSCLSGRFLDAQAAYWKTTLAGAPELLSLPTDRPRPPQQSYSGGAMPFALDEASTRALRELSARHGTTLFMTLLAGWAIVLSRFSGQDDIVVGTPAANRGRVEVEGLIGFFVNTLALRLDLSKEPTVAELLRRTKACTLDAQENQDLPFEQVVEQANPTRCLAYNPVFQVMFSWEKDDPADLEFSGLRQEPRRRMDYRVSKFDLTLSMRESECGIEASLEYATALFERTTVERITRCYRMVLEGMVANDELGVFRLPILSAGERDLLVETWNATSAPYHRDRCIHEFFEEQARLVPATVALEFGGESLSYAELNVAANRVAHGLHALGVKPDDRVGIRVERGLDRVIGVLGILKAGGAYVPLDPGYPEERQRYIVEDSAPVLLLVKGNASAVAGAVPVVDIDTLREGGATNLSPAAAGLSPANLAYVIYTSGSTGKPKGVMVEHRSACNLVAAQIAQFETGPGSRVLQFASFGFDACVFEILWALCRGATLVIPASNTPLAGESLIRTADSAAITHALLPPAVLASIPAEEDFETLRVLVVGGDILTEDIARRWAGGRRLVNAYGPTEITVVASLQECRPDIIGAPPPIGRPISNTRIYILDAHREPMPVGVAGELYIGGAGVARGYLNRPELTAERFVEDPFRSEPDARMYRTGDLGRWRQDGTIEFLGRNDFQVKIRGFRIELGEIEARLDEHSKVRKAVVLAREDAPGEKRLVAYYLAAEDVGAEVLRNHLSDRLPDHMIPAVFIRMDALPLDPNGKLDRKALPAPAGSAYASQAYEAPRGEFETALASIWSELLNVERVGRHDGFFELGGHSLLAAKLASRLRATLNVDVPISAVFTRPAFAEFARLVAEAAPARLPAVTKADREDLLPPSFAQRRQWFLAQLDGAATAYHVPYGLRLRGALDVPALRRALDRIVARHESLRTTFVHSDGEPQQRIATAQASGFSLVEKTSAGTQETVHLANAEITARFDLERGPLIRGLLIHEAEDVHALLVTMHHIVSDGWSMGVFVAELGKLYEAYAKGEEDPLPPLDLHYADYAIWQRKWVAGELLRKQEEYWTRSLRGAPELLTLPIDRPRPPEQSYAGDAVPLVLGATATKALKDLGLRHGTTPFMTLLAGWAALLSRLSGQDDVVVGTPTANRGRAEIEGLIGFFVNTLALRLDLSGDPTVAGFLQRVKACSLGAQENQDIPFEQVVERVNPARSVAHSPLFQAAFSWESGGGPRPELSGLTVEPLDGTAYAVAKFDLSISLGESNGALKGALEYSTALFRRETVERIAGYYLALLDGMAAGDARPLKSIPILDEAERRLLTRTWNATQSPYPGDRCVHELFEDQARRTPGAIAVAFDARSLTYAQLNRRANRVAHRLRSMGIKPDDRVAICMERGLEMLVGLLGILKAGGAYVAMDPTYPEERLEHILADSAPIALLTSGDLAEGVVKELDDGIPVLDLGQDFEDQPDTNPAASEDGPGSASLAYVIYTSGSTGTPKGVMVEHRSVVNLIADWLRRFDDFGKAQPLHASLWTSFSFDVSVFELFVSLSVGATVNIVPDEIRGEPTLLFDWLARHRIAFAYLPPFFVRQMDELMASSGRDLSLRYLLVGVEPLLESQLYRIQSSRPGRGMSVVNGYGPTETTVFSSSYEVMKDIHRNAPIGRPIGNTQAYILDACLEPVPVGVAGELHIGGAGVARGYLNLPALTAERFVVDPFCGKHDSRMYKTGDLARWMPDGNLEFLGRNDHQVKLRGFRIELGEIETRLTEHPGVREAVVIAREDASGDKMLVAYHAGTEGVAAEALRAHLSTRLPKHMIPTAFVGMDALPLLPNGKLDHKALPAPDLAPVRAGSNFLAPRDEHETRIAAIWTDVLGIPDIGIDDNFFDLGGESFKAFRVVGRIGNGIGVTELFKYPTVRQLAERLTAGRAKSAGLLHELTRPVRAEDRKLTLICIPFPGGGPISYQPLAKLMPRGCTVLGLEIPGHDFGRREERPLPIEEIARRCAEEIRRDVTGPIAFYGHCAGGALTVAIAAELENEGVDISRLFIGGHFPTPHLSGKVFEFFRRVFPIHKWASNRSAFDLLKSFGFFDEITDKAQQDFVMGHFVREHQEIEDFYTTLYNAPFRKLKTPLTSVIGEMDRATTLYQERYREWEYFSDSVDFAVIPKAGHYFIKHQAGELSGIIESGTARRDDEGAATPGGAAAAKSFEAPVPTAKAAVKPSLRTFFTVAIGEMMSVIGSTLTSFALGVWVYQQTGLVSSYALMMVFVILPVIALAPIAGTLADRVDRKKIMVANNCLAGLSTAAAATLIWTGSLQVWHVYLVAGVAAVANAFRLPAYMSVITQIVPKRYYGKANGFVQLGTGLGAFLGPALAGALMGLIGLRGIVMTDLLTFLIAIAALLSVRLPDSLFERREEPFFKEMIGGWRYIIKRHSLVAMILMTTIANFVAGLIESLVTPLVLSSGGAASLGIVMAANGAGILAGSTVMSIWGGTRRRIDGALGSVLLSGVCIALAGANPAVLIQASGMFGFGFALALANAHWISTIQTKVGLELQGRVMATNFMLMEATVPLGYLAAGPLADRVFEPLMANGGDWASTFGGVIGTGPGRGIGLVLMLSGAFVVLWSIIAYSYRPIRCLEDILPDAIADEVIEAEKDAIQAKADLALSSQRRPHAE